MHWVDNSQSFYCTTLAITTQIISMKIYCHYSHHGYGAIYSRGRSPNPTAMWCDATKRRWTSFTRALVQTRGWWRTYLQVRKLCILQMEVGLLLLCHQQQRAVHFFAIEKLHQGYKPRSKMHWIFCICGPLSKSPSFSFQAARLFTSYKWKIQCAAWWAWIKSFAKYVEYFLLGVNNPTAPYKWP